MSGAIGVSTDNQPLAIGDIERRSGLYILGKPRIGKSWLMINLAVQDAKDANHGIFFIDPHGEAVEEVLNQIRPDCSSYKKNVRYLLIDPTVCVLLQKPENNIRVRSNQQIEKKVPIRTVADMTNEMVQELTELPKYTAYAKVLQGHNIWKGKIETLKLKFAPITDEARRDEPRGIIMFWNLVKGWVGEIMQAYFYETRKKVEDEIQKRQEPWVPIPKTQPFITLDRPIIEIPESLRRYLEGLQNTQTGKPESTKDGEKSDKPDETPPPPRRPKKPRR